MIAVLHNNSCSKSRGVLDFLNENNVEFEIRDIVKQPLSEFEIKEILNKLGSNIHEIIRKNETIYLDNFEEKDFSDEEWIKILSENPLLIQRPILIKDSVAIIGRPLEKVKEFTEI